MQILGTSETVLGYNLFAYCENSPIIFLDYFGYGKTYVFYYDYGVKNFKEQAFNSPYFNAKNKKVHMIPIYNGLDFINKWNNMKGVIDYIYIYLHGAKGLFYFLGGELRIEELSEMKKKVVQKDVCLFSCHGGDGKIKNNLAFFFARLCDTTVYACTGKVSFICFNGKYYARKGFDLGEFRTFFYQKRFIFWGKVIPKVR